MSSTHVVILAGGIGSRFWPFSLQAKPKQFLDILGTGRTLLQSTYDRSLPLCPPTQIWVVTNDAYAELVAEQLPDVPRANILIEPARKNTAPAIAYAAFKIAETDPDACMVVAASDHVITNEVAYVEDVAAAVQFAAANEALVTIGIKPTRPDTGYGYIQFVRPDVPAPRQLHRVKTFTEKPNHELAQMFVASGDFVWNSGIFIWSIPTLFKGLQKCSPELFDVFQQGVGTYLTDGEARFIAKAYELCPNISIDYALMEKAKNVYVLPGSFAWSDLGTWGSLYEQHAKDYMGNAVTGTNVMMYDAQNCMVMVPHNKLVVLQGLDGYIIVENEGTLLICKRTHEQEIKTIHGDIKRLKGEGYL